MSFLKAIGLGAIATAARARLAEAQQTDRNSFSRPAFNEGARNKVDPWPLASKLGWDPGKNIANLPSVAGGMVSGPSRSWLAQVQPAQESQPGGDFAVSVSGDAVHSYHPQIDPEKVYGDRAAILEALKRKRLQYGLAEAFKDRRLGSVPSAFVEQRLLGSGGILDAVRGRFGL